MALLTLSLRYLQHRLEAVTGRRPSSRSQFATTLLGILGHQEVGRLLNVQISSHRAGELSLIGTVVFALRTASLYEGLAAAILTDLGTSYRSHGVYLQRNARQTLANAAPPVI